MSLRNYEEDSKQEKLYREMYKNQTLKYVIDQKKNYEQFGVIKMSMFKALSLLDTFVDSSDPDLYLPNSIHAFQTAERIRKKFPNNKEYQITGLIHDIGKVLYTFKYPEWSIVGDTFVLGCRLPKSMVYYNLTVDHPDRDNTELGIYEKGCGLENLNISFGHDEYLYMVLKQNKSKHKLSDKYLDIIRYHSLYPWHSKGEYKKFMNDKDYKTLINVKEFNEFDLYSKEDDIYITDDVIVYYKNLLKEYFFEELQW